MGYLPINQAPREPHMTTRIDTRPSTDTVRLLSFLAAFCWTLLSGLAAPEAAHAGFEPSVGVTVEASSRYYDRRTRVYFVLATVRNQGAQPLIGPTRLVVESASMPVLNADGQTPAGEPFFTLSSAADFHLGPGQSFGPVRIDLERRRVALTHSFRVETEPANTPPVADAGADQTPRVGDTITLDGSGSSDPDGDDLTYLWSIDEAPVGSTATLSDPNAVLPTLTIDKAGRYVFSLIVDDGSTPSEPDACVVDTQNSAPVANAGQDQTAFVGDNVTLDGSASSDVDGDPLTYTWSATQVPDGSGASLSDPTSARPSFVVDLSGDYFFDLVVGDGAADSPPDQVRVSTLNSAPTADAGPDQTAFVTDLVTLDGSASTDPDLDPLTYLWALTSKPPGSTAALDDPTIVNPSFSIDLPGTYVGALVVDDGEYASDPDTVTISTLNSRPSADAGADQSVETGDTAILDGTGSSDPDLDPLTFNWSLLAKPPLSTAILADPTGQTPTLTPDLDGDYTVQLIVSDGQLSSDPDTAQVSAQTTANTPPSFTSTPDAAAIVDEPYNYQATAFDAEGHALSFALVAGPGGMAIDPDTGLVTWQPSTEGAFAVEIGVDDNHGGSATQAFQVLVTPIPIPPAPEEIAPPTDTTENAPMHETVDFLYEGDNPIQTGVAPGTIEPERIAVVRGRVLDRNNQPLPAVVVAVKGHPELGQTVTRADGGYDLAVNGGGLLTLEFQREGYLPAQRKAQTSWESFAVLDDLVLVPVDPRVTVIDLTDQTEPFQIAEGSTVTDEDGSRQAAVLIPEGTTATMTLPDGNTVPLETLSLRATEYTVGPNGPEAMPGELPPNSGYTYAVELSADEALAVGATTVEFNQPVPFYVDNFLDFPIGEIVPVGYYDYEKTAWVPSNNGRVIKLLSVDAEGRAALDLDGSGTAADAAALVALGISDEERAVLATRYAPGTSLWRVQMQHLTPWDCNWPYGPPDDAEPPPPEPDEPPEPDPDDDSDCEGCVINPGSQTLGESINIVGTNLRLHYRSDRVKGRAVAYETKIPVSGAAESVPDNLQGIDVTIKIAGRTITQSFEPTPNQEVTWRWDGLDAYGREVVGSENASIRVSYRYPIVYYAAQADFEQSFAQFADPATEVIGQRGSQSITVDRSWTRTLAAPSNGSAGLGGWTLGIHHAYSPGEILLLGNGDQYSAEAQMFGLARSLVRNLSPSADVAVDADGTIYFVYGHAVWKLDDDGLEAVAGSPGRRGYSGDGGPAINARFNYPIGLDIGPDGSLYIADRSNNMVRRIGPDGIITRFAGTGEYDYTGDGGPATSAAMRQPYGVAVASDGTVYITDSRNYAVRKVSSDGIITTIAGDGSAWYPAFGGPASESRLFYPYGIDVDAEGNIYFAHSNCEIFTITAEGILQRFAGLSNYQCYWNGGYSGDGGPATNALLDNPDDVVVGGDGAVYIPDSGNGRVRRVDQNGIITTFAGSGIRSDYQGDGLPATEANIRTPDYLAWGPDGKLLIVDDGNDRIIEINPAALPSLEPEELAGETQVLVASRDGSEVYRFDYSGRHLSTLDALTGTAIYRFGYTDDGLLDSITDVDSRVIRIERLPNGTPTAIVSPDGQRTTLALDNSGWLETVTDPAGNVHTMGYTEEGLLTSFQNPNESAYVYTYDDGGRFRTDTDPVEGGWSLDRTQQEGGYTAAMTSGEGRVSSFAVESVSTGGRRQVNTAPDGTVTTTMFATDASETTNLPNGTVTLRQEGPDPRFGMVSPVIAEHKVTTPAGLVRTTTNSREAELSEPADPFSLTTLTDTSTVNGRTTTSTYDAATRTWSVETPEGRTATTTLNEQARITFSQLAGLASSGFTYNADGRLSQVIEGAELNGGLDARLTQLDYYGDGPQQGFLHTLTDPELREFEFVYDAAGRLREQTLPGDRTVAYDYDPNGNLTSLTPPGRPAHTFTYTDVDLVESYNPSVVANGGSTTYSYNKDKQLTQVLRPDGLTLDYDYDPDTAQLRSLTIPRGTYTYSYDESTGQLTGIQDPAGGSLTYGYDGPLRTSVTWAGEVNGSVEFAYDNDFRISEIRVNGADPITYTYDDDGLPIQVGAETLTYNPENGLLESLSIGNATAEYGYNDFGELTSIVERFDTDILFEAHYTRDKLGRIVTKTETVLGTTTAYEYGYDAAGRLAEVKENDSVTATYTYDANGNRLTAPGLTTEPVYDDQDRLLSYGDATYTYTANGELRTKTEGGETTTYHYDVLGNLVGVDLPDGTRIDYIIDGQNRRASKKLNGIVQQSFLYQDQLNPVVELGDDGSIFSRFVYASRSNAPDYMIKDGATYRLIGDHLGSPRLVVNVETGEAVQRLNWDVFGKRILENGRGFQPFGFVGGLTCDSTGLLRFGVRDYGASTGRWTRKDPSLFAGADANLYSYVHGDPMNLLDLSGRRADEAVAASRSGSVAASRSGLLTAGWGAVGAGALVFLKGLELNIAYWKNDFAEWKAEQEAMCSSSVSGPFNDAGGGGDEDDGEQEGGGDGDGPAPRPPGPWWTPGGGIQGTPPPSPQP
jgi:RHS repeat-associated protein